MKTKPKKETILSVLQDIRALLKAESKIEIIGKPVLKQSWALITDDGSKKTSELLDECKKLFSVWSYYSNDELDKLCPAPKELTVTRYKESIEPDCLNISCNDAIMKGIKFMSARERIILELQYFKETGKGLDIKGITITSTLDSGGNAVNMCRNLDGQFSVFRSDRDNRDGDRGPREQLLF